MTSFVLDASITIAWAFEDARDERIESVLKRLQARERALSPPIWMFEVANFVSGSVRGGRLTADQAADFALMVKQLPIEVEQWGPARVFDSVTRVAQRLDLTVYDASYLELAQREGLPLATVDRGLEAAAKRAGVESLLQPDMSPERK